MEIVKAVDSSDILDGPGARVAWFFGDSISIGFHLISLILGIGSHGPFSISDTLELSGWREWSCRNGAHASNCGLQCQNSAAAADFRACGSV
jgi:hypothetical protein